MSLANNNVNRNIARDPVSFNPKPIKKKREKKYIPENKLFITNETEKKPKKNKQIGKKRLKDTAKVSNKRDGKIYGRDSKQKESNRGYIKSLSKSIEKTIRGDGSKKPEFLKKYGGGRRR